MGKLKALIEEQGKVHTEAKGIMAKADEEKRVLTNEEKAKVDKLYAQFDAKDAEIKTIRDDADRSDRLTRYGEQLEELGKPQARLTSHNTIDADTSGSGSPQIKLNGRVMEFEKGSLMDRACSREYNAAFNNYLVGRPQNDLQTSPDTAGGRLVPPQFAVGMIKELENEVFMRRLAKVLPPLTASDSLGAVSLDAYPSNPEWTSEVGTPTQDSTMAFGGREFTPHDLAKEIMISNKLLRLSSQPVESIVRDAFVYVFGITEENAFLNGSGSNQPLGVFTASPLGISVNRDVATGNTSSAITGDGLLNAKYNEKAQYMRDGSWLFHRDAIKQIRLIKDSNGQYVWRPGLASDRGDTILDSPYVMSEYAPNTFTTGQYVGIFGDFKQYWIVDSLAMSIDRHNLAIRNNKAGFIGHKETDGMPVLEEAFTRVKLA